MSNDDERNELIGVIEDNGSGETVRSKSWGRSTSHRMRGPGRCTPRRWVPQGKAVTAAPDHARDRAARAAKDAYFGYVSADHRNWLPVVDAVAAELAKPEPTPVADAPWLRCVCGKPWPCPIESDSITGAHYPVTVTADDAMDVLRDLVAGADDSRCWHIPDEIEDRARALVQGEVGR